ncbi:hypothetical protein ART_0168 [Arthrobacter sp. PAMC 25486]|nr:hypothetical protein ART_0168 [Arthrobacter sp. PAMC 25486]
MGKIIDLSKGNMGEPARQQRRDQYATPLNGSSVGHGGQRFYGTGRLTVQNEGLYVTGVASISGTLTVAGTSRFSGQTFIYGPLEVTGDTILDGKTDIGGNTRITGTLDVTGVTKLGGNTTVSGKLDVTGAMATKGTLSVEGTTTLKSDLNVTTGGKITAGGMVIDPIANGGSLRFPSGHVLYGSASALNSTSLNLTANLTVAAAVRFTGLTSISKPANVFFDVSSQRLYYTV